jgi:hypothetical protein
MTLQYRRIYVKNTLAYNKMVTLLMQSTIQMQRYFTIGLTYQVRRHTDLIVRH